MSADFDEVVEHVNDEHADSVALIARHLAAGAIATARPDAVAATVATVDVSGTELVIASPGEAEVRVRHDFADLCRTVDDVRAEFLALLGSARERFGDSVELTSLEREIDGDRHRTFISQVDAVIDLTPTLRQITFRGGLDEYASIGGDEFLWVLMPPRGRTDLTIDTGFRWADIDDMPETDRPTGAYYSVRRWRPEERSLDMWFVLHGRGGDASAWASRAVPGQRVGLWGPRRVFDPPPSTTSYLLVVDETGSAAAASLLEQLLADDPAVSVRLVAEAADASSHVDLPTGPGVELSWVHRLGRDPGSTTLLVDAVREVDPAPGVYAFGAGESRRITEVRRHLRDVVGLPAEQVSMTGYWRRHPSS